MGHQPQTPSPGGGDQATTEVRYSHNPGKMKRRRVVLSVGFSGRLSSAAPGVASSPLAVAHSKPAGCYVTLVVPCVIWACRPNDTDPKSECPMRSWARAAQRSKVLVRRRAFNLTSDSPWLVRISRRQVSAGADAGGSCK